MKEAYFPFLVRFSKKGKGTVGSLLLSSRKKENGKGLPSSPF